jgi:hypothetical protein
MPIVKTKLLMQYSILPMGLYHSTRPLRSTECRNRSSRKDFLARRAGKSLSTLISVFPLVRRTVSFVGFCGKSLWATLSRIANFEAASKLSFVNREIGSHWVKLDLQVHKVSLEAIYQAWKAIGGR